ncbi:MAG: hypothetical protein ACTSYT_03075 [Candidatus Asgardarchaeia archaeon]
MNVVGEDLKGLIKEYKKIGPNGVDLSPIKVYRIPSEFEVYIKGEIRGYIEGGSFIEGYEAKIELKPKDGFYEIGRGEIVEAVFPFLEVPLDMVAFIFPRSTFNRLGIMKFGTAVLDSGYKGTPSQSFYFPIPAKIHVDEAWVQVCYFKTNRKVSKGYSGYYQGKVL